MHVNDLITYIKDRTYIANFKNLELHLSDQYIFGKALKKSKQKKASRQPVIPLNPRNIIVSADKHLIGIIGKERADDDSGMELSTLNESDE